MLKTHCNIEASWDRFFVHFGTVLEPMLGEPRTTKHWPAWVRQHFRPFVQRTSYKSLLRGPKPRFWMVLGGQVEVRKRTSCPQEPSRGGPRELFRGSAVERVVGTRKVTREAVFVGFGAPKWAGTQTPSKSLKVPPSPSKRYENLNLDIYIYIPCILCCPYCP